MRDNDPTGATPTATRRGLSRRDLLRQATWLTAGLPALLLLEACGQQAPAPPAQSTAAAKPAADVPKPQPATATPISSKPAEVRMGTGKGEVEFWAAEIKPGTVIMELGGLTEEKARSAFKRVAHKLPIKVKMIRRLPTT